MLKLLKCCSSRVKFRKNFTAGVVLFSGLMAGVSGSAFAQLDIGVGASVTYEPKYEGSAEYKIGVSPLFKARLNDDNSSSGLPITFRAKDLEHIKIGVLDNPNFNLGPVVGYRKSRNEDLQDRLEGLGDVEGSIVLGGYASVSFGGLTMDASAVNRVSGAKGGYDARLGAEFDIYTDLGFGEDAMFSVGAGTTYASEDYMDTYFGVTAAQATASAAAGNDLTEYDPTAGFKDFYVSAGVQIPLSSEWSVGINGKYKRLIGDAADSPIVEKKDQLSGSLGVIYYF